MLLLLFSFVLLHGKQSARWNSELSKKNLALLTKIEKAVGKGEFVDCNVCAQNFFEVEGCMCLAQMIEGCEVESYIAEGCYDCSEETDAVCMDWLMDLQGGDCDACFEEFGSNQGCECMADETCDLAALIPDGCHHCGGQADAFCAEYTNDEPQEMSCEDCTYEFDSAQGCECMMDEQCEPINLLPDGCTHCQEGIGAFCYKKMTGKDLEEPEKPEEMSCEECSSKFAAAEGCECMMDDKCDPIALLPDGCTNCMEHIGGFCQKEMAGKHPEEPEPETTLCVGDSSTFNAGWGGCDTYARTNRNFCNDDSDGTNYAYQVCEECSQCSMPEPEPEEPDAPKVPETPEEPEAPKESDAQEGGACFDNDAAMAAMFKDFMNMETCAAVLNTFDCKKPFEDYTNMGYGPVFEGTPPTASLRDQGLCSCSCPPAPTPEECCSKDWDADGENFCSMEYFIEETVPTCGMCLYDRQCEGFQEAYEARPDPQYATGLVYCCPDAKRCVDQRPESNHGGCDPNQQSAQCGKYSQAKCGAQMQNDEDYPKKCTGLCDNPNFPQDWMAAMSCEGPQEESAIGSSFFAAAADFDLQEVSLTGFAIIGLASSIYLAIVTVQKLTSTKYQTIKGNEMPAL